MKRMDMGISSSLAAAAIQTLSADGEYVCVCVILCMRFKIEFDQLKSAC